MGRQASETAEVHVAEVHLEACVAFVGDGDTADGVCLVCGHSADQHDDLFEFLRAGEISGVVAA
ncbi:MAG TPA: hypothetical protein VFF40_14525 [Acidimicrobiia bacterium]|nr:hypothetical protein [Acidimicrobiia bacterium]